MGSCCAGEDAAARCFVREIARRAAALAAALVKAASSTPLMSSPIANSSAGTTLRIENIRDALVPGATPPGGEYAEARET
eukprot:820268-Prymnesium_polylepis.2